MAESDAQPDASGTAVSFDELINVIEMVSFEDGDSSEGWICPRTGKILVRCDITGTDELPEDFDESAYIAVPSKLDLDLGGNWIAKEFVRERYPDHVQTAREIFGGRGAFRRFKSWLEGLAPDGAALKAWFEYEQHAHEQAIRDWATSNGLTLTD